MKHLKRFLVFIVLYFATLMVIQLYLFPSGDTVQVLVVKNAFSGLIAGAIFVFLIRKK